MATDNGIDAQVGQEQLPDPLEPVLVRCVFRVPRAEADSVLPRLELAFGCGGAVRRTRKNVVEVEAELEIRKVGEIVGKGVPVLVTERIPVVPLPAEELIRDADAWFEHVRRLG